ncbi:hypothetical protein HOY82DRAFT_469526, partial [Tuber indicum]
STPADILDFPKPGIGLYSNLTAIILPRPEVAFDITSSHTNLHLCSLGQSLHPGQFTPIVAYAFILQKAKKKFL